MAPRPGWAVCSSRSWAGSEDDPPLPVAALAAACVLLATGCTGEEEPTDAASTESLAASPTDATESPAGSPKPDAVVMYGGSGVSVNARCGGLPTYLALYEEFEVNREVRLGEVAPVGGGRLVGRLFVAPTKARGPNNGELVVDEKPGFGGVDDLAAWGDRVPLRGRLVQPGAYAVFAQVRLAPGTRMEALDFGYVDGDTTGSARLDVSADVVQKCRD